ncbi:MAG: Do family serine endopeptidase [Pseudomonadota bacterium]
MQFLKRAGKLCLLFFLLAASQLSLAALPAAVDGQPLPSLAPVLEKATPAVVNIATRGSVRVRSNPLFEDPFFRRFFDLPNQTRERPTQSLGSGVIVGAKDGLILTNHHVIENATEISVTLHDGRELVAQKVGSDPLADVALIQIQADGLTELPWMDSDALRVGDFVVAIGNPFGLGQTVTSGIVSALSRSGLGIEDYEDFIQTDASINPGNSGGALINLRGELAGINTAILGAGGGSVGIGFAIPANMARAIMQQLVEFGEVKRGRLGVGAQALTPELATAFNTEQKRGVVITEVEPGSAAQRAGLQVGDVIVVVGGRPVRHTNDVRNIIGLLRVGQQVTMRVIRDGVERNISAVIDAQDPVVWNGGDHSPLLAGAEFSNVEQKDRYQTLRYVEVIKVERHSTAWRVGMRVGDIVLAVNRARVEDVGDIQRAVLAGPDNEILLNIQRGSRAYFVLLK